VTSLGLALIATIKMAPSTFHSLFDLKSASKVTSPAPTYQKDNKQAPQNLRDVGILPDVELDEITPTTPGGGPSTPGWHTTGHATPKGAQTPKTPNELEMSRPPTPKQDDAVGLMRSWNSPPMTKWRILCCCMIYFANGMNDSGTSYEDCQHTLLARRYDGTCVNPL
jgi:hypothetical protein